MEYVLSPSGTTKCKLDMGYYLRFSFTQRYGNATTLGKDSDIFYIPVQIISVLFKLYTYRISMYCSRYRCTDYQCIVQVLTYMVCQLYMHMPLHGVCVCVVCVCVMEGIQVI